MKEKIVKIEKLRLEGTFFSETFHRQIAAEETNEPPSAYSLHFATHIQKAFRTH